MVGDLPEEDLNRVYYYAIFPNMLLSLHPDYVMFHTLWPEAPDRTRIFCSWLFHPDTLGNPAHDPQDGIAFWDMTNRQERISQDPTPNAKAFLCSSIERSSRR
jgi:Rieske 2Fe-2S family protein